MHDSLIVFGEPLKSLGGGRHGGYLIRFGSPSEPDLVGDYFDAGTEFWGVKIAPVLYNHGLNPTVKRARLGEARLRYDDAGVWAETEITAADAYATKIRELLDAGKLSWSSGSAGHLVERQSTAVKGVSRIALWPIFEASLTPTPAEFRGTRLVPIKALTVPGLDLDFPRNLADLAAWIGEVKAGRVLSAANRSRLESLAGELERGAASLRDLLATADAVLNEALDVTTTTKSASGDARARELLRLSLQLQLMELT